MAALEARENQQNGTHDSASTRTPYAERLLAHFAPFAEHIAYMQDILGEDFRKEALDLLGDSRFRTLRQHCLVYESLRKRGFTVIPWQERHVRSLLNQLADEEVTPCKLRQVWNTLKWFSKTFGLLKIDELHRLKSKKSSLEEALTDTVTRPQRKAVIWALEEGAGYDRLGATGPGTQEAPGKNRHEVLDAFILGFARSQVGCSARFNDLQHVHPKDLIHTSNTVELKAWQTKTVSAARINRNPVLRSAASRESPGGPPGWPRSTPPRRPREPSPSTPADNKRQSRRLKAGQQALAGLTLGSLPVSASDTPEAGTSTQRTGEVEELGGGNSFFGPMGTPGHGDFGSAYHPADHSRPQYLRQGHVPPDGFQAASLKRRWRKALVGTVGPVGPTAVQSSSAGGQDLCPHFAVGGQAPGVALVWGWVTSLPGGPAGGHQGDSRQPFFLDILHSVALNIQDPDHQFPRNLEQGVPLGVTDPP